MAGPICAASRRCSATRTWPRRRFIPMFRLGGCGPSSRPSTRSRGRRIEERHMSFTIIEQAPARLNRSELAVPGSSPQFFEKAAQSAADVVFLDLEDAVAPDLKPQARENIVQAINDVVWGTKTLSVRINGLDTPYMYRDLVEVLEQAGD